MVHVNHFTLKREDFQSGLKSFMDLSQVHVSIVMHTCDKVPLWYLHTVV